MEILTSILIIIGFMFAVITYQSRGDSFSPQIYLKRFSHLVMIFFNYFKDVGLQAAIKFKEIDWDLTATK